MQGHIQEVSVCPGVRNGRSVTGALQGFIGVTRTSQNLTFKDFSAVTTREQNLIKPEIENLLKPVIGYLRKPKAKTCQNLTLNPRKPPLLA